MLIAAHWRRWPVELPSTASTARQDAMLDFLICWHPASGAEVRHLVLAALRRRAAGPDHLDRDGTGPRLWSWCTSVWLPAWMRAAGLLEEARALARSVAELPAGAVRATKQLLRSETGTAARIEEELLAFRERLASAEFRNAAQAFFGKGRPG